MSLYLNLVVIQSSNLERTIRFYNTLGLQFNKEQHNKGPEHYSCEMDKLIFEIYPSSTEKVDASTRIGFNVNNLEQIIENIRSNSGLIISEPKLSPWGKRAVIQDPDGLKIELVEQQKLGHKELNDDLSQ